MELYNKNTCHTCRIEFDLEMYVTIRNLDPGTYGSKLCEFVKWTELTLTDNPVAKIVLFVQFNR
jgi:hypothetical protein